MYYLFIKTTFLPIHNIKKSLLISWASNERVNKSKLLMSFYITRKRKDYKQKQSTSMQVSTTCMDQASRIHNQRQVRVQKRNQRVKKKKRIEQRPLITRRVAGFYISDHAARRWERTDAFTTQCWILNTSRGSASLFFSSFFTLVTCTLL